MTPILQSHQFFKEEYPPPSKEYLEEVHQEAGILEILEDIVSMAEDQELDFNQNQEKDYPADPQILSGNFGQSMNLKRKYLKLWKTF